MITIQNPKLTLKDVKKIDLEITSHKCDPKYLISDEQNPEWKLLKCVMCGLRMTQRKRICQNCRKPYSAVYKLPNFCATCSKGQTIIKEVVKGGPFYV